MRKLALGLLAALVAVTGAACGGGGGAGEGDAAAVLSAPDAAADAGSAHMDMTMEITLGEQEIALQAEGDFDFAEEIGTMTMSAAGGSGMPAVGEMEMVFDGRYMYVKGQAFDAVLGGEEWGRIDLTAAGASGSNQFNQDPTQYLEWLRGAGEDVEETGEEEIDGVATTHYRADLSVDDVVESAPDEESAEAIRAGFAVFGDLESFPLDVWVDEDGLPRRIHVALEATNDTGLTTDVTIDLTDYGVEVDADVPESFKEIDNLGG